MLCLVRIPLHSVHEWLPFYVAIEPLKTTNHCIKFEQLTLLRSIVVLTYLKSEINCGFMWNILYVAQHVPLSITLYITLLVDRCRNVYICPALLSIWVPIFRQYLTENKITKLHNIEIIEYDIFVKIKWIKWKLRRRLVYDIFSMKFLNQYHIQIESIDGDEMNLIVMRNSMKRENVALSFNLC